MESDEGDVVPYCWVGHVDWETVHGGRWSYNAESSRRHISVALLDHRHYKQPILSSIRALLMGTLLSKQYSDWIQYVHNRASPVVSEVKAVLDGQ